MISNYLYLSSLSLSSLRSSLFLMLPVEFFSTVIVFFNFKISVFSFLCFLFVELLILSMYYFPKFIQLFYLCSLVVLWASLEQLFWILFQPIRVYSWISISSVSVTGSLLYFFIGVMFPWFFVVFAVSCSCLCIRRSIHLFQTLYLTSVRKDVYLWVGVH